MRINLPNGLDNQKSWKFIIFQIEKKLEYFQREDGKKVNRKRAHLKLQKFQLHLWIKIYIEQNNFLIKTKSHGLLREHDSRLPKKK